MCVENVRAEKKIRKMWKLKSSYRKWGGEVGVFGFVKMAMALRQGLVLEGWNQVIDIVLSFVFLVLGAVWLWTKHSEKKNHNNVYIMCKLYNGVKHFVHEHKESQWIIKTKKN